MYRDKGGLVRNLGGEGSVHGSEEKSQFENSINNLFSNVGIILPPNTANRYLKVLEDISHQTESLDDILNGVFQDSYNGLVVEKEIPISSYCSHHVLPWFGQVYIGIIANGQILGLSKYTRIVKYFSVGLTIQEEVTKKIADFFVDKISQDVIVMIEAIHTCKVVRGITSPFSKSCTVEARGLFRDAVGPRMEFFYIIK